MKTADDALREINDNIMKLKKIDIQKSNQILDWLTNDVVDAMKKNDKLFNSLFRDIYYSGSYYDGLKIREPDEFDLNIVLDTRKIEDKLTLVDALPGYCKMKISEPFYNVNGARPGVIIDEFLENTWTAWWTSTTHYILPSNVKKWFAGVYKRSMHDFPMRIADGSLITNLETEQNGPAFTLKLEVDYEFNVDIDLAVVFSFDPINLERNSEIRKNIMGLCNYPKQYPPQNGFLVPISAEKFGTEWSKHFPMAEKNLIWNKGCAKPVIRFLKQFRDVNKPMANLKSYALKNVVMTMIRDHPQYAWEIGQESHYFLLALEALKRMLEDGKIEWIFHRQSNLLRSNDVDKMLSFVSNALSDMEDNRTYETWKQYFVASDSFCSIL